MELRLVEKVSELPFSEYLARNDWDSRSFLCAVKDGGGAAQQWLDQGHRLFEGNNATRLGSMFDKFIEGLIGGKQQASILIRPPSDVLTSNGHRRGKAYEEWRDSLEPGVIECSEEEHFVLTSMADNLFANPAAKRCVQETTETQVSVFFELDGHRIKVRPDGCTPEYWWDLKTTSSRWDRLFRSVMDFGYLEQEWLYVCAAMACGLPQHRMPFVFVQSVAPYTCHVFYLPADLVERAGQRMLAVMDEVRLRRSTGIYTPADHGEITELEVPRWMKNLNEEEVVL